jgi:hypothetical protein
VSSQYRDIPGYGNFQWKAPVDTAADLPTVNNLVGDARVTKDTATIYVWNGSAWVASGGGGGGVSSVGLADGSATAIYSISGSPVTSTGTLTFTFKTQTANTVLAGPTTGSAAQPTFRSLVSADIPNNAANTTGTAANIVATSNNTLVTLSSLSLPYSQITGAPAALTASDSVVITSGNITLVGDSATPGASKYYGTNSGSTLGYYSIPVSGINQLTGDVTAGPGTGSQVATLATVNSNVGSFGSSTSIPSITVNAKGLVTAASGNAVVAPAGTLTGTTLASNVVTSSLTTVGTIGTGVWQGTAVGEAYGGTGFTSYTAGDMIYASALNTLSKLGIGTTGNVLTVSGGVPIWAAPATSGTVTSIATNNGITGGTITTTGTIGLATIAANSVLANTTGSSAVPIANTLGTVTEATSSVLTLSGWSDATIGSPTIQVIKATGSVSGYLSSTDWTTFNGKQSALTFANSIQNTSGTVNLVGDSTSPGNSFYYGTNSGGTKGFYVLPAASGTSTPTANSISEWDANVNMSANMFIPAYTTTANGGTVITLTVSSTYYQFNTGSGTGNLYVMPVTSTLVLGQTWEIVNNGSSNVTVFSSNGINTITTIKTNQGARVTCILTSGVTATSWSAETFSLSVLGGTVTSVGMSVPAFLSVSGSPITSSGTLAVSYSGTALPIANGGTAVTSVTTASTATAWAGWDANKNMSANNFIEGYATTATAAGTTALVVGSADLQYFTGTTTQTVTMPVTSGLVTGMSWTIVNLSTGVVTVQSSGANTIQAMAANTQLVLTCIGTTHTTTVDWNWIYTPAQAALPTAGITALTGDVTASGTGSVATTAAATQNNITSIPNLATVGTIGTGTWHGTLIGTAYGGTGTSSAGTQYGVTYYSTTTAMASTAAGTTGQVLTATTSSAPTWASPAAPTLNYAAGYQAVGGGGGEGWTVANQSYSYATPTCTGTSTYTSRVSSGITVTQPSSSHMGITFTPSSATAVYQVTCTFNMANNGGGSSGVAGTQLYNSTQSSIIKTGPDIMLLGNSIGAAWVAVTMSAIFAPASNSAQTILVQAFENSTIGPDGIFLGYNNGSSNAQNCEWTVLQIGP